MLAHCSPCAGRLSRCTVTAHREKCVARKTPETSAAAFFLPRPLTGPLPSALFLAPSSSPPPELPVEWPLHPGHRLLHGPPRLPSTPSLHSSAWPLRPGPKLPFQTTLRDRCQGWRWVRGRCPEQNIQGGRYCSHRGLPSARCPTPSQAQEWASPWLRMELKVLHPRCRGNSADSTRCWASHPPCRSAS